VDAVEAIRDLSWMAQLSRGALERFELNGYSVCAVSSHHASPAHAPSASGNRSSTGATYLYRLLFFEAGEHRPFYAVNLESSILGAWTISAQESTSHHILERLNSLPSYEQFRIKALEYALPHLDAQK